MTQTIFEQILIAGPYHRSRNDEGYPFCRYCGRNAPEHQGDCIYPKSVSVVWESHGHIVSIGQNGGLFLIIPPTREYTKEEARERTETNCHRWDMGVKGDGARILFVHLPYDFEIDDDVMSPAPDIVIYGTQRAHYPQYGAFLPGERYLRINLQHDEESGGWWGYDDLVNWAYYVCGPKGHPFNA